MTAPALTRANLIAYFTIILFGFVVVLHASRAWSAIETPSGWPPRMLVPFVAGAAIGTQHVPAGQRDEPSAIIALTTLTVSSLYVLAA